MQQLFLLWDDSHIWGLIALRALRFMGIDHKVVRAADIAGGILRTQKPSLLLVPGGNARHKALHLGPDGREAIREYVAGGGQYLGFCGGAGLALDAKNPEHGLALCPWKRASFDERIQHFMSGHLHVCIPGLPETDSALTPVYDHSPLLPVWWPGRFAPEEDDVVTLARYAAPAKDFWLADLPVADLPDGTFAAWRDMYGIRMSPSFLEGQPCIIHGHFGKGGYVLSYSHLETPDSPDANRWFAHLLRSLGGLSPRTDLVPPWDTYKQAGPTAWTDPDFASIFQDIASILESGLTHGLLFQRTGWLFGWRTGLPGASLCNLWAAACAIGETPPTRPGLAFFAEHKEHMLKAVSLFKQGCIHYLLAERLAQTASKIQPDAVSTDMLRNQREALFGPPMCAGGAFDAIMSPLDELAFLQFA